MRGTGESARLLLLFGAASLGAVGVGALVCALSGVPAGLWVRNLAAWLVGGIVAAAVARIVGPRALRLLPWIAAAALAGTFLGPGQEGVHRWIAAGPLTMNVAMLVGPAAVVALAAAPRLDGWAWGAAFVCLVILVLQPDASQATAFGLAAAVVVGARSKPGIRRAAVVAGTVLLAGAAWLRPDPLPPVPEVEEIVELAWARAIPLAVAILALLAAAAAAPAWAARRSQPEVRLAGAALSACLGLWAVTPFLGAYPVPLAGVGVSPVLGAWLGVGLLAGVMRRRADES